MNSYIVTFRNKMRIDRTVDLIISAPSREAAVTRGETLLTLQGKKVQHYQRPTVNRREAP